jgi:hypothetical protein
MTKTDLTKAIDILTKLAESEVVKASQILVDDLEKLELQYHRQLREISAKYGKRKVK